MIHRKNLIKLIEANGRQHGTWQAFGDFVEVQSVVVKRSVVNGLANPDIQLVANVRNAQRHLLHLDLIGPDEVGKLVTGNRLICAQPIVNAKPIDCRCQASNTTTSTLSSWTEMLFLRVTLTLSSAKPKTCTANYPQKQANSLIS